MPICLIYLRRPRTPIIDFHPSRSDLHSRLPFAAREWRAVIWIAEACPRFARFERAYMMRILRSAPSRLTCEAVGLVLVVRRSQRSLVNAAFSVVLTRTLPSTITDNALVSEIDRNLDRTRTAHNRRQIAIHDLAHCLTQRGILTPLSNQRL
jgi:hypothetical protein